MGNLCCCFGFSTKPKDSDNSDEALFRQRQTNPSSSASSPNEAVETRQSGTILSPPGPLPCNAYSNSQQARVIITGQQVAVDSYTSKLQLSSAAISNGCNLDSSMNPSSGKLNKKVVQNFNSSEAEDVCPTCLEEYSTDNPKITLKCCHVYHLSCILEWQQRKNNCPVCDRVMEFDEIN